MPKPKKKIFLVNRDLQLRYTKAAILVGLVSTVLSTILILYPLYTFEILRIPRFLPIPILAAMVLAAFVNIAFIAIMGIFLTHKIAGPMYSLIKNMRKVEHGDYKAFMRIRDDDEFKYVIRNFNELLEALVRRSKDDLVLVEKVIERIKTGAEVGDFNEAISFAEELKNQYVTRLEGKTKTVV